MAKFTFHVLRENAIELLSYDNASSELLHQDGTPVVPLEHQIAKDWQSVEAVSKHSPGRKSGIRVLKISLGLSCNYECSYCSQRFVPHAASSNPDDVQNFIDKIVAAGITPERIEFWGGEPLVYWKTLKPLAEKLRELFPSASFGMVTNGSLLDSEKNEWIDRMGFGIGLSHDGPGYHLRGLDPLDDPEKRAAIMDLFGRLNPQGRISINAMMNGKNQSRASVQTWMIQQFGPDVTIGEGSFIDPYDEGGLSQLLGSYEEHVAYRKKAYFELRTGAANKFDIARHKVHSFVASIVEKRPASAVGQKCTMDRSDRLAVDLHGNVITCQNVSAAAVAPNGQSHLVGSIDKLDGVALNTSTHWSHRKNCSNCPVLQLCGGSCMFLEGPLWDSACDSAYSDNVPFLAAAIESLTGGVLMRIDGDMPEDRKDVFGLLSPTSAEPKKPAKKIIEIRAVQPA